MIKKILFLIIVTLFINFNSFAQCNAIANNACTTSAPTIINNSITCTTPGNQGGRRNFRVTNMIANATYRVSNCSSGIDTQMTIRNAGGVSVGYNDDDGPACAGTSASIDFVPPATGDYRIQINKYNCATTPNTSNGDIVVTLLADPPPPLTNDDCANAISLPSPVNTTCTFVTYTNLGATDSGIADPGCANYSGGDVWFTVVVPANGEVTVDTDTGVITDSGMAIYSGTCGTLALIECDDDDSAYGALMSGITLTGRTPGETLFVRFWEFGNNNNGTFDICATTRLDCTTPVTPTALTFGTVTNSSIAGSFTASSPVADNYLVLMNTTGTPPTAPTNGTAYIIGDTSLGATVIDNDANTNFIATGLNASTDYYFFVYAYNDNGCSGGPTYSTYIDNDTTTDVPSYCIPSSSDSTNYIDDFITTGSVADINHTGTGYSAAGYGNFSGTHIIEQYIGLDVDFTINFVGGTYETNIWVDWNNDLDFNDANEKVFQTAGFSDPTIGSFTVLATAVDGDYRMRVRSDWLTGDPDPCDFDEDSEAHDYTLRVTTLPCSTNPSNILVNVTSTTEATVTWDEPVPPAGSGYDYYLTTSTVLPNLGTTPTGSVAAGVDSLNLTGLTTNTTYYIYIRSNCGGGLGTGVWIPATINTCDITSLATVCNIIAGEQGSNPYLSSPIDANPSSSIACSGGSVDLQAYSRINETTDYDVEQIPYNPPAFISFADSPIQLNIDDQWAPTATDLSTFDFCYYGQSIDQALMGPNGSLALTNGTFPNDALDSTPTPDEFCGWEFEEDLPYGFDFNNALYDNTIYGVYHDLDPSASNTDRTFSRIEPAVGPNGCRRFIFGWVDVPMFGDNSRLYTGAIVLYEFTNVIEVYIEEKLIENGNSFPWNDGNAVVGVQGDSSAGEAVTAPCRNSLDTNWETRREAWRFVPNGNVIAPNNINWYIGGSSGTLVGTGNTLNVTTANTYTAVAEFTNCTNNTFTIEDDIDVVPTGKTWNGSVSSDWYTAANWTPNGVPTNLDCIIIPYIDTVLPSTDSDPIVIGGPPIPPPAAECLNLTILNDGFLDLDSQANLSVTEWVNVNFGGKMILRSGANLVQDPSATLNTNVGEIKMQRTVASLNSLDYVYWSTPVENFEVTSISPGTNNNLIWEWLPTVSGNGVGNHGDWQNVMENMTNGKGYIVRDVTGTTIESPQIAATAEFIGRPNNGSVSFNLTRGTHNSGPYVGNSATTMAENTDDNWNLVGNPYPSAISADAFITENANTTGVINGTIHLWTHASAMDNNPTYIPFYNDFVYSYVPSDYIDYNITGPNPPGFGGFIGAGQGFFVQMEHTAPIAPPSSITFDNTMRDVTFDNTNFFRVPNDADTPVILEKHRIWLDLIDLADQAHSTLVGYIEGATQDVDQLYDGYLLSGSYVDFYSLVEEEKLSIQGRSLPFLDSDTVPLGLRVPNEGVYSIAINTVDGSFLGDNEPNIYLEDTYLDVIHDLRISPYSFNTDEGVFDDRFVLRYNNEALNVNEFENNSDLIIYVEDKLVKLKSKINTIESVIVYNVLGQTLIKVANIDNLNHTLYNLRPSEGVLFVKAKLSDGRIKIQKIIY